MQQPMFDFQGHRGARGLMPENTIPAFHLALDLRVTTLELDLAVNAEGNLVISHEPWFSHEFSLKPDGSRVSADEEQQFLIYRMTQAEIETFDVGSAEHPRFLQQKKMIATKPLFSALVRSIESRIKKENLKPVFYNIETKSLPQGDNLAHPEPAKFVEIVHREISELGIKDRVIVQSFDFRTLIEMKKRDPSVVLAMLLEDATDLEKGLSDIGFVPEIYSPNYETLTPELIKSAHRNGMRVIPWTVNNVADMERLISWGVDGLISDYPDLYATFMK
jgi:glycerophosphoryl diester phosphodiesterase